MTNEFSLKDQSSKPYAWMIENIEASDIGDAEEFVKQTARTAINATNYGEMSDEEVYQQWRDETYEFDQAVAYIQVWVAENTHVINNSAPTAVDGIFYFIDDNGYLTADVHDAAESLKIRFVGDPEEESNRETILTANDVKAAEAYRIEMNDLLSDVES